MVYDFLSTTERSARMARIRGKNTAPELALRKALHKLGLRFRLHVESLSGRPDIVLPRYKTVILVHGCFWHRHEGCRAATIPKSNVDFWSEKFAKNIARDESNINNLRNSGWQVLIVWQCDVSTATKAEQTATRLAQLIRGTVMSCATTST